MGARTIAAVFEDQAAGYDRYVRDNWERLEQWERDYHQAFTDWSADRRRIRRLIATPERRGNRPKGWGDTSSGPRSVPRTVGLAYALAIAGLFFFPMLFLTAALCLAVINAGRGLLGHGLVQIVIAGAALALYQHGIFMTGETLVSIYGYAQSFR
jgi:hypothetical protein